METIKCDICQRDQYAAKIVHDEKGGFNICKDKTDCNAHMTEGVYMAVAEEVIEMITGGGLNHAECARCEDSAVVIVWSKSAKEQIGSHLIKRLRNAR